MAIGKASDFKIYQDQFKGGVVETLTQVSNVFNGASNGAIRLSTVSSRGDYRYESFFANIANLVTRRDTTSVSTATDEAMSQEEFISVKLNRKIGPVANTYDSFRKILANNSAEEASFIFGQQAGKAMQVDMLNSALLAARAALDNQSDVSHTISANGTLNTQGLIDGMKKMGDAAGRVVAWVMHSKPFFDLVTDQVITNKIDGVSNVVLASASPITLNRPVIVTDSASLVITGGSPVATDYYTLGLVDGGAVVENTEEEQVETDIVTGLENLVIRIQGEFAYNVGVKGFKWATGSGANPNATALGTGSNWTPVMDSYKDWAGFVIQSR